MDHLTLVGVPGSPYSRKLRAVLRYRRDPFEWVVQGSPEAATFPTPRVPLIPQLILDGEAKTDTTPLIREIERRWKTSRSVIPTDGALAFLDAVLEDYGDEWLTKAMFHYRWAYPADIAKATAILPRWSAMNQPDAQLEQLGATFAKRQIERLWVVGSNKTTGPIIERSYIRFLTLFEDHLRTHRFIMGGRPGVSDFGLYGQLTQLAGFDPTPIATTLEHGPRVAAYTDLVEDLSGLEPRPSDWFTRETLPETFRSLIAEVGRVYAPFLLANSAALEAGAEKVQCEIDGAEWEQKPFPYQGKCLLNLRSAYETLLTDDRMFVDSVLEGTGCETLFAGI